MFDLISTHRIVRLTLTLVISGLSGCAPETIYQDYPSSINVYSCLDDASCIEALYSRTTFGCYLSKNVGGTERLSRNRFVVQDQDLVFEDQSIDRSLGSRFIGSLFFLEGEGTCSALTLESSCREGCLLRLDHGEVVVSQEVTMVEFISNGMCSMYSEDPTIKSLCFDDEPDMGGVDMGGLDMGGCDPLQVGQSCTAEAIGSCAQGTYTCQDDLLVCSPSEPNEERCDLDDNDCDGSTDEDLSQGETCEMGVGACETTGLRACIGGQFSCVAPEPPSPAESDPSCDGIDDDCDGSTDEDYTSLETICGQGLCASVGALSCQDGQEVDSCQALTPDPEIGDLCDGQDNDCDGLTDEGHLPTDFNCGIGACQATAQTQCQAGTLIYDCTPLTPPVEEIDTSCDGIDDDCDESVDEGYVSQTISCGLGACVASGTTLCQAGEEINQCQIGEITDPLDTLCDGIDGDCDGSTDEGFLPRPSSCGRGACEQQGTVNCVSGQAVDSCQEVEAPDPTDSTCDLIDGDCDGSTDEGYRPIDISCGFGACERRGTTLCQAGVVQEQCIAGPRLRDEDITCDGVDDDCDQGVDESFIPFPSDGCGDGVCFNPVGQWVCVNGSQINECQPLTTDVVVDALCDGIDDDCDGTSDEDYAEEGITCGLGDCEADGTRECVNGIVIDNCTPVTIIGAVEICDQRDNDCDGSTDEDLAGNLDVCNGTDDDCDANIDEDFVRSFVACVDPASCVQRALTDCVDGLEVDRCELPAQRDSDADGIGDPCAWVTLPDIGFEILRHEVTYGAYQDCVNMGGCDEFAYNYNVSQNQQSCEYIALNAVSNQDDQFPLRCVVNDQLAEYCEWIGGRLATEEELLALTTLPAISALFECPNAVSSCPGDDGLPRAVCSKEASPGASLLCDLAGNMYEMTSSEETLTNGKLYMRVCFDDYASGNGYFTACAPQEKARTNPRMGGRCIRPITD